MDERYITIKVEEYKALIEFQLRRQIEAEYEEELGDLNAQLHEAVTYNEQLQKRIYELNKEIKRLGNVSPAA